MQGNLPELRPNHLVLEDVVKAETRERNFLGRL
jgi:hypothetical protein